MSTCYLKINGIIFDTDVAISDYDETLNVLDGENANRVLSGRMIRDIKGAFLGHKVTVFRRGDDWQGIDRLWDYLVAHSIDDSVMLEAADGQGTIEYEAYYTTASRKIEKVVNGINYWGSVDINFIPMEATVKP